jgi:hypothetical protein
MKIDHLRLLLIALLLGMLFTFLPTRPTWAGRAYQTVPTAGPSPTPSRTLPASQPGQATQPSAGRPRQFATATHPAPATAAASTPLPNAPALTVTATPTPPAPSPTAAATRAVPPLPSTEIAAPSPTALSAGQAGNRASDRSSGVCAGLLLPLVLAILGLLLYRRSALPKT